MRHTASPTSPTPGNPGNAIVAMLAPVALGNGDVTPTNWSAVKRALAALPLMTVDYGLCCLELENARKYLESTICEPGAAAFEVRLLLGRLARLGFIQVELPKAKGKEN